jgi:hypothetical protein
MKTITRIIVVLCFLPLLSKAQTWSALGTGVSSQVRLSVCANGNLYVGNADSAGGKYIDGIGVWNGTTWSTIGGGTSEFSLASYKDNIYVGGNNNSSNNPVEEWNGTTWSTVGTISANASYINNIIGYNGDIYISSYDASSGSGWVSEWNGTSWTQGCGGGLFPNFVAYNGKLIAQISKLNYYYYMTGTTCTLDFKAGGGGANVVYNGNLYSCGNSDVEEWNGTTWSSIGSASSSVNCLAVYNGNLYVGGCFTTMGGVSANNIAEWNGTTSTWSALGLGIKGTTAESGGIVYSLSVDSINNILYVGGAFTSAGGNSANNIAKWTSTPTGISNTESELAAINIYPNPCTKSFSFDLGEKSTVSLSDITGRTLYSCIMSKGHQAIDVSTLAAGTYIFIVNNKVIKKLIKE